jgi:RHH-type proline utilization regulon transcriptional repressor/proline dehydrogenase/delta 1-pyrroline-5-carboxylate dehydrogenase
MNTLRNAIEQAYRMDETECVLHLLQQVNISPNTAARIQANAAGIVREIRNRRLGKNALDAFLVEYDLSTQEGIALMCLAEALLRVPDEQTANALIRDKITQADWEAHLGKSSSMFVNAATWGLALTGKLLSEDMVQPKKLIAVLKKLFDKGGESLVHKAMRKAMRILGGQFVMGQTIEEALKRAVAAEKQGYSFSYDMLGEAARTAQDAQRYFNSYSDAIEKIAASATGVDIASRPGISIKLSALHPRYEFAQKDRVLKELIPRVKELVLKAKSLNVGITIDAEEADRLDLSLDIIEAVFLDSRLEKWEGFGLALQSYQKRAWYVLDWLADLARKQGRRFTVRLIKGAYWDSEIKVSQVLGLEGYPVFTRKNSTDVSFLACAQKILAAPDAFYPQFATHNAHSVSAILEMVGSRQDFEFQCLHGMGYTLYDQIIGKTKASVACRVYAPVGGHEDLLAYLVRRLLENGANSSFVNQIVNADIPVETVVVDPLEKMKHRVHKPHANIPLPIDLYGRERKNSAGFDLSNRSEFAQLASAVENASSRLWEVKPTLFDDTAEKGYTLEVRSPSNQADLVGTAIECQPVHLKAAFDRAAAAASSWAATPVEVRAACLEKAADLFEKHRVEFISLAIREGGKVWPDAVGELREAVDFCRYYASQARHLFASPMLMPGPTGERNRLYLRGRGPMVCISPWNFPLAIFTGQVVAALVAGNPVMTKPAEHTPLIAGLAVKLLHEAGIPEEVLQFLPAKGRMIGEHLLSDPRLQGLLFTGSTETARRIYRQLAAGDGPICPLIAETGGQNAMIVDSSALPEQVVADAVTSAFGSAGQRCSALRVLFVQEEVAPKILTMLKGAMEELRVGDPSLLSTDIGPVISTEARDSLRAHAQRMEQEGKLIYAVPISPELAEQGAFFGPCAFEIDHISRLTQEVFGPILHVIRYPAGALDDVIAQINSTGYGLTLGIHSRIESTIRYIQNRVSVGNIYVNRNMIGAVVGVQPFGGEGLSGTGPKAGGPHYLLRLSTEHTVCVNTTASGGNTALMSLEED